jgi:hypothetical protein
MKERSSFFQSERYRTFELLRLCSTVAYNSHLEVRGSLLSAVLGQPRTVERLPD